MKPNKTAGQRVEKSREKATENQSDSSLYNTFLFFAIVFIAYCVAATFIPSSENWGIHHLGFLPLPFQVILLAGMILFLVPAVQKKILKWLDKVVGSIRKMNRTQIAGYSVGGLILLCGLFWIGREQLFLLGDGNILIRKIVKMQGTQNIPEYFPREPFVGLVLYFLKNIFGIVEFSEIAQMPFRVVSIISGVGFFITGGFICFSLMKFSVESLVLFFFITVSGTIQLFFGYVEMYALSCFFIALFVFFSLRTINDSLSLVYPVLAFCFAVVSHLAMLCFLPGLLYVMIRSGKRNIFQPVIAIISGGILTTLIYFLSGFTWDSLWNSIFDNKPHTLSLLEFNPEHAAYAYVSINHLLELVQLFLLVSPFLVLLLVTLFVIYRHNVVRDTPLVLYFLLLVAGGVFMMSIINPDLGLSRDWDALAPLFLPLIIGGGILYVTQVQQSNITRRAMLLITGITLFHVAGWISLNAHEEESLARFESLPNEQTWRKNAVMTAYEELAVFHRSRKEGNVAVNYFKKYLAIDSTNPRIWASMGYVYKLMGDEHNQLLAYESAAKRGLPDRDIIMELGMLQVKARNQAGAISAFTRALTLDSLNSQAHYYLALTYFSMGDVQQALNHFKRTWEISPTALGAYIGAIRLYMNNNERQKATETFSRYLQFAPPNSAQTDSLRNMLGIN